LSLRDRDLISIQEAREALERASEAQKKFAAFSQEQVDAVVEACANAATAAGEQLARVAVEETGYGNVPDKIIKNQLASVDVPRAIRGMKTVGILREDREKGIVEIAEPVGVVAAIIPSTNPTSTAIYKTLISLKARNAVVMSPHPSAMRCICDTVSVLLRAALKMGAPEGLIECLMHPTMLGTQELMKSRLTGVILATGGTGLVRAAYSSGRPAYGVGPGNVPAMIERMANVKKAVADIFAGKTFDYGTICSSEQAIVAEEAVREQALEECRQQGGYFLTPEEIERLGGMVFRGGSHTPNPQVVGKPATVIAEMAGIKVPASTRVLIAQLEGVGRDVPLSAEKLSPILAFYSAENLAAGIEICVKLLQHGGSGHTAAIHTQSEAAAKQYGAGVPAFRVVVNTASVHGSIGYSTNLFPAMTLGCGSPGGNITSDNIGPQHLLNVKRVAWESRGVEHRTIPATQRLSAASGAAEVRASAASAGAGTAASKQEIVKEVAAAAKVVEAVAAAAAGAAQAASGASAGSKSGDVSPAERATIAKIVERVFTARGIPRGAGAPKPAAAVGASVAIAAPACAVVESAASEVVAAAFAAKAAKAPEKPAAAPAVAPATAAPAPAPVVAAAKPAAPAVQVMDFVCENDVRMALTKQQKIFIGPKTILTPSARDMGYAHEAFVMTDVASSGKKSKGD
jgi:acetaldehyde dehydrogenase (acetylating)